ncbi:tubby like protein 10 [Actinidia rufa]|uniref:Tubby like protein 10 n=1 Tax=Actinidia rufa TaxID=165716 RepID=A0A7J0H157_9ERIC|nr:tubby like protein 10 [Actinidia rufa]
MLLQILRVTNSVTVSQTASTSTSLIFNAESSSKFTTIEVRRSHLESKISRWDEELIGGELVLEEFHEDEDNRTNSLEESDLANKIVYRWDEGNGNLLEWIIVVQVYKQFVVVVVGMIVGEVPSEEFGEVALTVWRLCKPVEEAEKNLPSYCQCLDPGMGAIRRKFAIQVTLCPPLCLKIVADRCPFAKFRRGYSTELAIERQLGRSQSGQKERGPDSSSDLADPSSWVSVSRKPNAEGGDGVFPLHLPAGTPARPKRVVPKEVRAMQGSHPNLSCRNLTKWWWRIFLRTTNRRFFLGSSSETRPNLVGNALPTVNRRRGLWLCKICLETDLTRLDLARLASDKARVDCSLFGLTDLRSGQNGIVWPCQCSDRPRVVRRWRVPTGITVDKYVEFFYDELAKATDDFSIANKIGQGGLGAVYYPEL